MGHSVIVVTTIGSSVISSTSVIPNALASAPADPNSSSSNTKAWAIPVGVIGGLLVSCLSA